MNTFNVLEYNIYLGGEQRIEVEEDRTKLLRKVMRRVSPDLLVLLECNGWEKNNCALFRDYERALGMKGHLAAGGDFSTALMVSGRVKVLSFDFDPKPYWHLVMDACLETEGLGEFQVLACHLHPFSPAERAREMELILSRVRPGTEALILGDFNAIGPTDAKLPADIPQTFRERFVTGGVIDTRVFSLLDAQGYVDLYRKWHPKEPGYTIPTALMRNPLFEGTRLRLDYIFAGPQLARRLQDIQVLESEETQRASDHFPLLAEFRLSD
ncbi:MAG: endonuclease/exonuclease/phosphatase family protein [Candidatus Omnitrophica bacterium]|nr:endonuclease/exonuclease/phosphatase family protein [Candidatus Omnitrophota bacterium]